MAQLGLIETKAIIKMVQEHHNPLVVLLEPNMLLAIIMVALD